MKPERSPVHGLTVPQFINQAVFLDNVLKKMDVHELARLMAINPKLANLVKGRIESWDDTSKGSAAALTFRGDIYSGLSAAKWNEDDATFAQDHLFILSGLYGLLRPYDEIKPYRLEMGYKLKLDDGLLLDKYWEVQLKNALDPKDVYINLTAKEYFKTASKQLSKSVVIAPKFLTISEKTMLPVFVTVHAKIARGSFANWLIKNKIDNHLQITNYDQLGYVYDRRLSTKYEPVFVCHTFGGIGLSVRLK